MDEDGGLAVVRPTRWKTRDDHLVKENADPSEATGGKLSLGSRDDDDADHDDVNMDDVSREYDERVVREDDAAFDQLLDLAEGAMHSVRLKASPAKTEPRETEDDDDDDEGSEVDEYDEYDVADDRAAEMEHDASEANSARENSDVSASSSFDFDVDEPDADDRGGATTTAAEPTAEPTASPARAARAPTRRETRPARVSGATRASARLVRTPHWRPPRHGSASSQPWARSNAPRRRRWPGRSVTTPTSTRRSARRSATTCLRGWSACAGACARSRGTSRTCAAGRRTCWSSVG